MGCKPLRYYLSAKRVNFLHYILNLDENDLLKKFYNCQQNNPSKADWCLTVEEDLKELEIELNMSEIKNMSRNSFKSLVKKKSNAAAIKYLNNLKSSHSKLDNLTYTTLEIQPYLKNKIIFP